ncbi:MAG TPA: LysR substrate-binding domain-containing protein [Prolixibacteraceae bacterium]|nr:LysR substrate-binding domain-containing protein [Prolixibacteraceae bacterium]HPR60142.1 LysR substrate-binding domain-containing protein [Prolixibacteraceae bacterium]
MTLLQLSYVLELSHYQSFSKTAQKLNISQPALSLQISKLEEELGINIFKRSPTQIVLTAEGEQFVEKTRELIQMAEKLKDLPFEMENKPEGNLKIGVIPTLAPYWFSLFVDQFSTNYPNIKLTIFELKTENIVSDLRNGMLDAGFISTPVEAKGLEFKPLFYEKFYLYVSENHELAQFETIDLNTVDLKEMWYLEEGNCFQNQVDSVCVYAKEPGEFQNIVYLSNSIESLCRVVENAGGITFIPEMATLSVSSDKEQMIKEIEGTAPVREISMVTTRISKKERLLNILLTESLKVIPKRMQHKPQQKLTNTGLKL